MILIDFSQIVHSNIYNIKNDIENDGLETAMKCLRHLIINHILYITKKYSSENEIILCIDGGSWRYDIHPNYKARRKIRRMADTSLDMEAIMAHVKEFEEEIKEHFPFVFIKVKKAEGDDVIGTLTYHFLKTRKTERIIIVSNDKDFKQLHVNKRVVQYNLREKKEIHCISGKNELMYLILKGDDSDDIPNVRTSNLNVFVTPNERQKKMWNETKLWEHINNNSVFDELLFNEVAGEVDDALFENFERNRKLIDLRMIPELIKDKIISEYEKESSMIRNGKIKLLQYFIKEKMSNMSDRIDEFGRFYNRKKEESNGC